MSLGSVILLKYNTCSVHGLSGLAVSHIACIRSN